MNKTYLYSPRSMDFFAKRAIELFGWTRFYPIDSKRITSPDATVIFWLYSKEDYEIFQDSKVTKRVYWHGFDAYLSLSEDARKILASTPAFHACQSQQQQYILNLSGVSAMIRPFLFADPAKYTPVPQSETIEDIYINVNKGREEEYGLLHFLRAAKELPNKRFHVFGIERFLEFPNVVYYGRLPEEQYDAITKDFDLYVMGHRNAGTSQSAVKAALRGQGVVSINQLSFIAYPVSDYHGLVNAIKTNVHFTCNLPELNQIDWI